MPDAAQQGHTRADLVHELRLLRGHGIIRVESPTITAREFPILRRCVSAFAGPDRSFVNGLEALMRTALDHLPNGLLKTAGTTIYGFHTDFTDAKPGMWKDQAVKLFEGKGDEDFKKVIEPQIFTLIAGEIEVLTQPRRRVLTAAETSADLSDSYVSRPFYEAKLRELVEDGQRLIVLVGDAGVGKATLARHTGRELAATYGEFVEVDAGPDADIFFSLVTALDSCGLTGIHSLPEAKIRFAELLANPDGPAIVVLCNIEDERVLRQLLPTGQCSSTVIVTSRTSTIAKANGIVVRVDNMTAAEALEVASTLLPEVEAEDLATLTSFVGRNPLAITQACCYLAEPDGLDVGSFIEAVRSDAANALDLPGIERTLTTIYRLTLEELRPPALALLDIVLAVALPLTSRDILGELWSDAQIGSTTGANEIMRQRAFFELEQRSLIHVLQADEWQGQFNVRIHAITRRVLYGLRAEHVDALRGVLLGKLEQNLNLSAWEWGTTLPMREFLLVRSVVPVILRLDDDDLRRHVRPLALALRALRQLAVARDDLIDKAARVWLQPWRGPRQHPHDQQVSYTLAAELASLVALRPERGLSSTVREAVAELRARNGGLWFLIRLLQGNEWLPCQVVTVGIEPMRDLASRLVNHHSDNGALGDAAAPHDQIGLAKWLYARGTVHFDNAEWGRADRDFTIAQAIYAKRLGGERFYSDAVECIRRLAETQLKAGNYDEARLWISVHWQQLRDEGNYEIADNYLSYRLRQVLADVHRSRLARATTSGDIQVPEKTLREDMLKFARMTFDVPADAFYPAAAHSHLCLQAFEDLDGALAGLHQARQWCEERQWAFAATRFALTICKLDAQKKIVEQGGHPDREAAETAWQLAQRFQYKYGSPFWTADALATALALGLRSQNPDGWVGRVLGETKVALEKVNRLDKLAVAENATSDDFSTLQLLAE